jgi:hypothetical protein
MVASRLFAFRLFALTMATILSVALDPVRSIETFAAHSNYNLVASHLVVPVVAVAIDDPVATNTALVTSAIPLEDLVAFILSKNGPLAVTSDGTDVFASSLMVSHSASRRLGHAVANIKSMTDVSIDNVLAWFSNTLEAPRAAFLYAVTALTPKSSAPIAFLLPEIHRNYNLVATPLVSTAVAIDDPVATNTAPVTSAFALEDLIPFVLSKNGPLAVTSDGTDVFASSLLVSHSASRRLGDAVDDTKPSTNDSVDDVLAWFATTLKTTRAAFRNAVIALTLSSPAPTALLSPEIINILSKNFPLIMTTCEVDAMDDAKPSTNDSVDDVLAWFATTVKTTRAAFRHAVIALTLSSPAPTALLSPEIINLLSKQCPLIMTTCEVDAMDDAKPSTNDSVDDVLAWFATTLKTTRAAFRHAVIALTLSSPAPTAILSPEIINLLSKKCPFIVTTCEVDAMDDAKPSTSDSIDTVLLSWLSSTLKTKRNDFRHAVQRNATPIASPIALDDVFASSLAAPVILPTEPLTQSSLRAIRRNTTPSASPIALDDVFASSFAAPVILPTEPLAQSSLRAMRCNATPIACPIALDDVCALKLQKDGPITVTHEDQCSNSTDLFASGRIAVVSSSVAHEEDEEASDAPGSDRLFWVTLPLVLLQQESTPVAAAVPSPIAYEEEEEATNVPESDRLFWLTIPLVLLQEEATPVAASVPSPVAHEEDEEATNARESGRLFWLLVVGTMVIALVIKYVTEAIWYYYWSLFIHVDAEADADADDAVFDDADDVLEDVDDGVAGQDDVPVEAPVAAVTIAAPLRRSKRIAAQQCNALGPRRSARLASKPRVNYKS